MLPALLAAAETWSSPRNPLVEPALQVWGVEVALYLFLGGWAAGVMVLGGLGLLRREDDDTPRDLAGSAGLFVAAAVALAAGMLALFADLEYRAYVLRLYTTFQPTSPMSWGAWILVLVYPVLALAALTDPRAALLRSLPGARTLAWQLIDPARRHAVAWACAGLGVALGVYTGVLLGSLGARPLWSSALLGPLFLVSGLSTAAASIHLLSPEAGERRAALSLDTALLGTELALLGLFLLGLATASAAHAAAARLVLGGPYTAVFWVGVVALGLVLPLLIQLLQMGGRIAHTPVAALLVMGGGLILRLVVVAAGQASAWPGP